MNPVSDQRVLEFLRTEAKVRRWIEDVAKVSLVGEDLLYALKDGVVLCQLMLDIDPNSIPRVQKNTKIEFKLKENTFFFLEACKELGVPKHKLFQTTDLWEPKGNLVRVVDCLVALATVAAKKGFQTNLKSDSEICIVQPDASKFAEVRAMLPLSTRSGVMISPLMNGNALASPTSIPSLDLLSEAPPTITSGRDQLQKNNTPQLSGACLRGIIRFQAVFRAFRCRHLHKKQLRDLAYRQKVAHEILKTEEDYVNNLDICIKVYLGTMQERLNKKPRSYMTKENVKILFSDIQLIHKFNERLLERLKERLKDWSAHQKLGDIFLEIVGFLKVYTNYVQNFDKSIAILEMLQKKEKFKKLLVKCKNHPDSKLLELSAFLIMPVQRIPRYNLLLQDLVRHTWPEHIDFENLNKAVEQVREVAIGINEKKRDAEEISLAFEMQALIEDKHELEIIPQRRFVKDGSLYDVEHGKERIVFLFNDVIVLGKPLGSPKPGAKQRIKCSLWRAVVQSDIHEAQDKKKSKYCMTFGDLVLAAKTEEERAEWLTAAKKVRLEVREEKRLSAGSDSTEKRNSAGSEPDKQPLLSESSESEPPSLNSSINSSSQSRSPSKDTIEPNNGGGAHSRKESNTLKVNGSSEAIKLGTSSTLESSIVVNTLQDDLQQPTVGEDTSDLFISKTIIMEQLHSIDTRQKKSDGKNRDKELGHLRDKLIVELGHIEKKLREKNRSATTSGSTHHLRTRSNSSGKLVPPVGLRQRSSSDGKNEDESTSLKSPRSEGSINISPASKTIAPAGWLIGNVSPSNTTATATTAIAINTYALAPLGATAPTPAVPYEISRAEALSPRQDVTQEMEPVSAPAPAPESVVAPAPVAEPVSEPAPVEPVEPAPTPAPDFSNTTDTATTTSPPDTSLTTITEPATDTATATTSTTAAPATTSETDTSAETEAASSNTTSTGRPLSPFMPPTVPIPIGQSPTIALITAALKQAGMGRSVSVNSIPENSTNSKKESKVTFPKNKGGTVPRNMFKNIVAGIPDAASSFESGFGPLGSSVGLSPHSDTNIAKYTEGTMTVGEVLVKRWQLVDTKLETYLTDEEFIKVFKLTRQQFYSQPKWRQDQQKRDNKLL